MNIVRFTTEEGDTYRLVDIHGAHLYCKGCAFATPPGGSQTEECAEAPRCDTDNIDGIWVKEEKQERSQ